MSLFLFIVGALAFIAGASMIGFGIPINEFSFGNTLILAGTTAAIGGLIIIGLGAVVAHLRRLAEGLGAPASVKLAAEIFETSPTSPDAPFAEKLKPVTAEPPAPPVAPREPISEPLAPAPSLRNPAVAPSLRNPATAPAADEQVKPRAFVPPPAEERRLWRPTPPTAAEALPERARAFESSWSMPEPEIAKPAEDAKPEPKPEPPRKEPARAPELMPPPRASAPRAIAILKSGVVDGMGYTLYVDGSIEAELPQGTLRFASITELRSYLEKGA